MKKLLAVVALILSLTVITGFSSQAFNSATHIYIAEQVFPDCGDKIDLDYGSIAPDLALYVSNQVKWPDAFNDTHYRYIELPNPWGSIQKAFDAGWFTHSEASGADHYAHIEYPLGGKTGYVIQKADALMNDPRLPAIGLTPDFAHFAIEVAIDLLLKQNDIHLGEKLLKANLLRSWQDAYLLTKVLVWKERRTDQLTLSLAELTFRSLVGRYATALALPGPMDRKAIVTLGVQLAQEQYGINATAEQLNTVLGIATDLCNDYYEPIKLAIEKLK